MRTLADMDRELRQLRRKVKELEGAPSAREASERDAIIGEPERPDHLRGFAAACAESKADLAARQLREARAQLKDNPGCIETAGGQAAFRRAYSAVPGDKLSSLFRELGK